MNEETYRLNSRLSTEEGEYLVQTLNDNNRWCVTSSLFSDGILLESRDETIDRNASPEEMLQLVKETHEDRTKELEYLITVYGEVLNSQNPEQMQYLGEALFFKKMNHEAMRLFRSAVELRAEFHQAWKNLGLVYFEMQSWKEACEAFLRAVELRPNFADYRNRLGEAYLALDSCKRAVIEFDEAVKINVYYGEAYLNLALAYILNAIRREDFKLFSSYSDSTTEMLQKAEVLMPDMANQEYLEAKKYFEKGELEHAFQKLLNVREKRKRASRNRFSNSYMKFMLGSNQVNERFLSRRIKSIKEEIAINPHYADLHHDLAVAYTLMGSYIHQKAVEEYDKALSINPEFEKARRNLKLSQNELKGFQILIKAIM